MNLNAKLEESLNRKMASVKHIGNLRKKASARLSLVFSMKKDMYKLAQGEPVEIDGVLYEELEDGTIVEVESTPEEVVAEPESYTVEAYDMTFTVGEEYANWYGVYRVLDINASEGTMDVEYIEVFQSQVRVGEIKTYPIEAQAQTISKAKRSKEIQMRLDNIMPLEGDKDAFTMGIMAAHGYISAEVGPKHHVKFPERYKQLTGEDANQYIGSGLRLSPNENRWSYTLRIHLPLMPEEVLSRLNLKNAIARKEGIEINDNALVWGLFKKGFSIGRNEENITKITANLSDDEKRAFMQGFVGLAELQNIED